MNAVPNAEWLEANQRWLTDALDELGDVLDRHRADRGGSRADASLPRQPAASDAFAASMQPPPALDVLCETFRLSRFERDILLLCAGVELDGRFASRCADALGHRHPIAPTYSLALAALPDAHWSALAPGSPLRRWRLVEIKPGESVTTSPLRIDERILHYIAGISYLDPRLESLLEPLMGRSDLVPSHQRIAERIADLWSRASTDPTLPVVQLYGQDAEAKHVIVAAAAETLGLTAYRFDSALLPASPADVDALSCLWAREAALMAGVLVIDCHDIDASDAVRRCATKRFLETTSGALVAATRAREIDLRRSSLALDVPRLTRAEQLAVWRNIFDSGRRAVNGECLALVSQFDLGAAAIRAAAREVLERPVSIDDRSTPGGLAADLWAACRTQARPAVANLAQRIEPRARWEDLVLPASKVEVLHQIAVQVRHRYTVYDEWGFAAKSGRGLGITALFWGQSGTGKTMATEVLANELSLDLYRIDLSSVVSKYIGETEKNLRQIFDAAEAGSAILLFDEADALFGKRSEVKDSHDRYANFEISYLLQRMEEYRGLAILTTNVKTALDPAFQRRIRFIVQFPFPDAMLRAEIWRRSFPIGAPIEGLDVIKLARLNIAGGHIRNIALNAAFRAADERASVQMRHLLDAARSEYAKMEKPLTDAETREWMG